MYHHEVAPRPPTIDRTALWHGFSLAINPPPRSGYRSAEGLPLGRLTHCRTNLAFSRTGGRPIRKFRSWQNRAPEPYVFPHMDSSRSYKRNPNLVILSEVARQASRAVEGPRDTTPHLSRSHLSAAWRRITAHPVVMSKGDSMLSRLMIVLLLLFPLLCPGTNFRASP